MKLSKTMSFVIDSMRNGDRLIFSQWRYPGESWLYKTNGMVISIRLSTFKALKERGLIKEEKRLETW